MNRTVILWGIIFMIQLSSVTYAETFYRSNRAGMKLEEITSFEIENYQYVLIQHEFGTEIVEIFMKGIEELSRSTINESRIGSNLIRTITVTDRRGLISQTVIRNGKVIREKRAEEEGKYREIFYSYDEDDSLLSAECYLNDRLLFTDTFYFGLDGRLRQIRRKGENEKTAIVTYSDAATGFNKDILEWHQERNYTHGYFFSNGSLMERLEWSNGNLHDEELISYDDGYKTVKKRNHIEKKEQELIYDNKNNLIMEKIISPDGYSEIQYVYSMNGLLIEERRRSSGLRETIYYSYSSDETLAEEKIVRNGELHMMRYFSGGNIVSEEIYKGNQIISQNYFPEGLQVNE